MCCVGSCHCFELHESWLLEPQSGSIRQVRWIWAIDVISSQWILVCDCKSMKILYLGASMLHCRLGSHLFGNKGKARQGEFDT